jgi:hypothetical protein
MERSRKIYQDGTRVARVFKVLARKKYLVHIKVFIKIDLYTSVVFQHAEPYRILAAD